MHRAHPFYVGPGAVLLLIGSIGAVAGVSTGVSKIPSIRDFFSSFLGPHPGWKAAALMTVAFALANLKNLPFVWHVCVILSS